MNQYVISFCTLEGIKTVFIWWIFIGNTGFSKLISKINYWESCDLQKFRKSSNFMVQNFTTQKKNKNN
jgi:hypothetical protein